MLKDLYRSKTNTLVAIICIIVCAISCTMVGWHYGKQAGADEIMSHVYPRCGVVVEVNYDEGTVAVEDGADQVWVFEGCEDWMEGDLAAMIMDDNGTPDSIYDDVILDVLYGGASEG